MEGREGGRKEGKGRQEKFFFTGARGSADRRTRGALLAEEEERERGERTEEDGRGVGAVTASPTRSWGTTRTTTTTTRRDGGRDERRRGRDEERRAEGRNEWMERSTSIEFRDVMRSFDESD